MIENVAVVGASGAIGHALVCCLSQLHPQSCIHAFSQQNVTFASKAVHQHLVDYQDELSIQDAANIATQDMPLDLVLVTNGVLHADDLMPEKSLRDLTADKFRYVFEANTIVPALMAKHFLPKLRRDRRAVFAALSARVGSISDNRMGGWYAYRASKAALNMLIKTAAIEVTRRNKSAVVIGLHPGTVDSTLSKPFQNNVAEDKLFSPEYSADRLLTVVSSVTAEDSGKCFAWDGRVVPP